MNVRPVDPQRSPVGHASACARLAMSVPATLALVATIVAAAHAQILPDRFVVLDPLADHSLDTSGFTWLNDARLHAEFIRYAGGDADHRWNAKTGGVVEALRWDSTADIGIVGTMEVVVDPNNDITFNPRAIIWEEGVLAGFALGHDIALQAGYIHRCKHDIDNLEILARGRSEQRTLIYSGIITRLVVRRIGLTSGSWDVVASGNVRNDLFLHLLDDRLDAATRGAGDSYEAMIDALSLAARIDASPGGARWRLYAMAGVMATAQGAASGFTERFADVTLLGSVPYLELGIDLFNPRGSAFCLFLRGEWQRDAQIRSVPTTAHLFGIGVRIEGGGAPAGAMLY